MKHPHDHPRFGKVPQRWGRFTVAAALAVPTLAVMAAAAPVAPVGAASGNGTLAIISGDNDALYAAAPDGSARHLIVEKGASDGNFTSVSMDDDGMMYLASDDIYDPDDDHIYELTQNGTLLDSWQVPNPGEGELYGGISDSEIRRDGQRLISQSIWSNCNGGGFLEICSVQYVTTPGSADSLGQVFNLSGATWLGTSNLLAVDGGRYYYRVGDDDAKEWFEDDENNMTWTEDAASTADGSVLVTDGTYDDPNFNFFADALFFYSVDAAPPAKPAFSCMLPLPDLIGSTYSQDAQDAGFYLDSMSFSPNGDGLAFAAGSLDDKTVYVVDGLNTSTCEFDAVTEIMSRAEEVFWGHFDYDPTHGPTDPDPEPDPEPDPQPDPDPDPDPQPDPAAALVVPMEPGRFWDTRNEPTVDGRARNTGRLPANATHEIKLAGRGNIPTDATGVVANLTVIGPDGPGYATLYPCTTNVPGVSTVNYFTNDILANNVTIPLSDDGTICAFTRAGTHLALDINGYIDGNAPDIGITPARYLDTRTDGTTFDGRAVGQGTIRAGSTRRVQIAGRGDIPSDATAAIVNATAIFPGGAGYLTLYPCGQIPSTSTVNYAAGQVVPNGAITALADTGELCIYSPTAVDVAIDVTGYIPAGVDTLTTVNPARLYDSRSGEPITDGTSKAARLAAGSVVEVQVTGRAGIPDTATAAFFNLGVIAPDGPGFVTLFPCTATPPGTSNLNHATGGGVRANNAATLLSDSGSVCVYTLSAADIILDVTGYTT